MLKSYVIQMSEARRHHYISECYLKGFTPDGHKDSKLFAIDLKTGKAFCPTPGSVANERDFNYIEGLPHGELERHLSGFEGQVAAALQQISADRSLANEEARIVMLNMAALFAVRNPRNRDAMNMSLTHTYRVTMDMIASSKELWESYYSKAKAAGDLAGLPEVTFEQLKSYNERNPIESVKDSTTAHIRRELKTFNSILPCFVNRRWLLCLAPADSGGFITCDHPVSLEWADGAKHRQPPGYCSRNATTFFPVNREMLAVGTVEGASGVRQLNALQVTGFNSITFMGARGQIYAASDQFSILDGARRQPVRGADIAARRKRK